MRKPFLASIVLLLGCALAWGRAGLPGHNPSMIYPGTNTGSCFSLDQVSVSATFAYALRKLSSTYGGSAVQLTKTGGATQDIGFVGCDLDVAAVTTFCASAAACTVTKFYDQTGNGHTITSSAGWSMKAAGVFSGTMNGHPVMAVLGGGYNNYNNGAVPYAYCTTTTCSWFGVAASTGQNASGSGFCNGSGNIFSSNENSYALAGFQPDNFVCVQSGSFSGPQTTLAYVYGTNSLFSFRFANADNPKMKLYLGGGVPATNNTATSPTVAGYPVLGERVGFSNTHVPAGSLFAEWIGWSGELGLADSNIVGSGQGAYWGITWTNITS